MTIALEPLAPSGDESDAFEKLKAHSKLRETIKAEIVTLRERVAHFNLPFLSLPAETSKDVALQVFINMNTNSKPLSIYDIIVAEIEGVAEESLHDRVESLTEMCPNASHYGEMTDLILSTSALLQDHLPNNRGMIDMDKQRLIENWPKLERGLERMAGFLAGQGVFDVARLPTNAVLAVIAAAYDLIPDDGDFLAKAEKLLRRYLWSAFFTDRYENSAASRAYADFRAIKVLFKNPSFTEADVGAIPVLNRSEYPLADADSLMSAGWPKAARIEARGILAVTTYFGAFDFADDSKASYESIQSREYHHVFPDALLSEAEIYSSLALNCALITWKTNRIIGRKDPLDYLSERVELADENSVRERLRTHLISYDQLSKAHYGNLSGDALKDSLQEDFRALLRDRANLVAAAVASLSQGEQPSLEGLWSERTVDPDQMSEELTE